MELGPPLEGGEGGGLRNSVSVPVSLKHHTEVTSHIRRLQQVLSYFILSNTVATCDE